MAKITVITLVHNPGAYIYPCIDSVLGQTFGDFEYVILDNASSDGSKEVLENYAKKDARIRLYRNEDNSESILTALQRYTTTEYFTVLDHDDYLESNALELLYHAAEKEDLDVVFGKSELVNAQGEAIEVAGINRTIECLDEQSFIERFDALYWQMRTLWGKLMRTKWMKNVDCAFLDMFSSDQIGYAWDTVFVLSVVFAAKRLGTVGEVVHHYRILEKSFSRIYRRRRFEADWRIQDFARGLLERRQGLTLKNDIYLFRVYFNAIMDTLQLAMNCALLLEEKCEIVREIITKEQTIQMFCMLKDYVPEENGMFVSGFGDAVVQFCFGKCRVEQGADLMYQWLCLLYGKEVLSVSEFQVIYNRQKAVIIYLAVGQEKDAYAQMLNGTPCNDYPLLFLAVAMKQEKEVKKMAKVILDVAEQRPDAYQIAKTAIRILMEQNILFSEEKDVWEANPEIVAAVCAEEYYVAINLCITLLDMECWQKSGGILELAINLAALLEEAEAFVALKKLSCKYLLQEGKKAEAGGVLKDLIEMCPQDVEVQELKNALEVC